MFVQQKVTGKKSLETKLEEKDRAMTIGRYNSTTVCLRKKTFAFAFFANFCQKIYYKTIW